MKTTNDLMNMCVAEYYDQLGKWYFWDNSIMSLYAPVLAFDYIARGEYYG